MGAHSRALAVRVPLIFYTGAALGPMGGNVMVVLMPLLQRELQTDLGRLSLAVTAYMVPFALFQVFSGALADTFSRRWAAFWGFAGFGLAALSCGLAPNVEVLILGRVFQGITNAFTTPILLAVLADVIPPARLGRTMGIFGAINTGGNLAAPVVAGGLAIINWRLAYLVVALASLSLAAYYWRWFRASAQADRRSRRPGRDVWWVPLRLLVSPRFWPIAALSAGGYVAVSGTYYLWAVYLADRWQVPVDRSGLLLSLYGLAGVLVGPVAGLGIDRFGRPIMVALGIALAVLGHLALGVAPDPLTFGVFGAALGGVYALFWAGLNTLALEAFPKERGAAASLYNGFKFLGSAAAPLVLTPIYTGAGPTAPFLAVALFGLGLFLPLALYTRLDGRGQAT